MTTTQGSINYVRFYDSVLHAMELGKVDQGLNLLVGLLDGVHLQGGSVDQAREALEQHMLHQMLLEDPIHGQAVLHPGDYAGLVDVISSAPNCERISTTGRRLFEATSQIGIIRALRQRRLTIDQKLEHAWKNGRRICIVTKRSNGGHRYLATRDGSSVTLIDPEFGDFAAFATAEVASFDVICVPDLADTLTPDDISNLLIRLRPLVSSGGQVFFSALSPDHVGSGWRRTFMNWEPNLHCELAVQRAAADARFTAQTCADESGCILWATLRLSEIQLSAGEDRHGN